MESKCSYFYVLYCKDHTLYGGYTTDLNRREKEHNNGVGAKYTKPRRRRPVKMIYAEKYESRSLATKAEFRFKKQARKEKESYLNENGISFPLSEQNHCIVVDKRGEMSVDE